MRQASWGFTLMEMLIVVAIIGVLAAFILPNLSGRSEEARRARALSEIQSSLGLALNMFESDTGRYPTTEQGLEILIQSGEEVRNWKGPYITKANAFQDPWGNQYHYEYPGQQNPRGYDLVSVGPDGQLGSEDDIANYDTQNTTQPW